jgi:hypothetical protein
MPHFRMGEPMITDMEGREPDDPRIVPGGSIADELALEAPVARNEEGP